MHGHEVGYLPHGLQIVVEGCSARLQAGDVGCGREVQSKCSQDIVH